MSITVELKVTSAASFGGNYGHAYLVFTDAEGNKTVFRGGFQTNAQQLGAGVSAGMGPLGSKAVGKDGNTYSTDPGVTVATGAAAESMWNNVTEYFNLFPSNQYEYRIEQNSNSVAFGALLYAGTDLEQLSPIPGIKSADIPGTPIADPANLPFQEWRSPFERFYDAIRETLSGSAKPPIEILGGNPIDGTQLRFIADVFQDLQDGQPVSTDIQAMVIGVAYGGLDDVSDRVADTLAPVLEGEANVFDGRPLPYVAHPSDPLVLDLDGNGFALTAIDPNNPVHFDIDADLFAESVGWVGAGDALLAHDLDGNGTIDGIEELFGDAVTNAFDDLAALDTNADGKIDSGDAEFASLRVWRDLDHDGTTDAGELQTMAQAGIASISLSTSPTNIDVNGNIVTRTAAFTRSDGTTGTAGSVNLLVDQIDTQSQGPWGPYRATAEAMPELRLAA